MKKLFTITSILAAGLLMAVSCDKNENPKFSENDAFVAFDKASVTVKETAGEVSIPVTLASVSGIATTISYEAIDGTAKAGVNYDLVDGGGTLTFSADGRTQYIKVKIYDPGVTYDGTERLSGYYSGDLRFTLSFKSTGDVNTSVESKCTVTIQDLDHPLSAILGDWTFSAVCRGSDAEWPCELMKDESDDHVVWFYDLVYLSRSGWDGTDIMYYGIVSEDLTTITIPLGQESEYTYSNGNHVTLYAVDADFDYIYDSGSVTATIIYTGAKATGLKFDLDGTSAGEGAGLIAYIPSAGTINYIYPPFTGTKD